MKVLCRPSQSIQNGENSGDADATAAGYSSKSNRRGRLAEFELGGDPFPWDAEPPELSSEVIEDSDPAAQHHHIAIRL